MLSTDLIAMFSGPAIFMGMGVVIATGWAIFMGAVAGMFTEAMLTGPVMVTGCWRLTGDVMLTVLVLMFICAAMVTGLLLPLPRFIVEVLGAETGVPEEELQTSLPNGERNSLVLCPTITTSTNVLKYLNSWNSSAYNYNLEGHLLGFQMIA